jgi:hypothetical protein
MSGLHAFLQKRQVRGAHRGGVSAAGKDVRMRRMAVRSKPTSSNFLNFGTHSYFGRETKS